MALNSSILAENQKRRYPVFYTGTVFLHIFYAFLSFRRYNNVAIWLAALAVGLHKFISLQCRVDDSSLVRIHWLENYRFSCFLDLVGDSPCQVLESFFSASSVILCIKFDTDIIGFAFIYNKACQILERIQCLSSLTDQDTHVLTFHSDAQCTFLINWNEGDPLYVCLFTLLAAVTSALSAFAIQRKSIAAQRKHGDDAEHI